MARSSKAAEIAPAGRAGAVQLRVSLSDVEVRQLKAAAILADRRYPDILAELVRDWLNKKSNGRP